MDIREEILKKYEEFAAFLESIHIEKWKKQFTRQELMEFKKKLNGIKIRSLSYEIGKLIDQMKKEEYPELLGVHHYPELREIDFMPEEKKIELDRHLAMIRKGQYVFQFWKFTSDTKRLKDFLLEKGIIEKVYHLTCPHHYNEKITGRLTWEEVQKIKEAIINKDEDFLEEFYDSLFFCSSCEEPVEYKEWNDNLVFEEYILIKERDTSLDNV
jgi:hypothetical protein